MKPCPRCVIAHRETNGLRKITYIPQFMELCRDCCDPGEVTLTAEGGGAVQRVYPEGT